MNKMIETECVVIGAGVVGLSIAAELSKNGLNPIVLESEQSILQHASSHNSEIIHSGVYYKPESLKGKLCVEGNKMLYAYCESKGIDYIKTGKLIVANTTEESKTIIELANNAEINGVRDIEVLQTRDLKKLEPNLRANLALLIPSTGVIDSHGLALSLVAEIERNNGHIITECPVNSGELIGNQWLISCGAKNEYQVRADLLINSSGLFSVDVSRKLGLKDIPKPIYVKGHYYKYHGKNPFRHLIYPIPNKYGLGIHTCIDISNALRFGPDSEITNEVDYSFNGTPNRFENFSREIRKYFPAFKKESLQEDYCGIRARFGEEHHNSDFIISLPSDHGFDGLINLLAIESPGLTSSLAIAKYISTKI